MKLDRARFLMLTQALSATCLAITSGACTGNFKGGAGNGTATDAGPPSPTPPAAPERPPTDAGASGAGAAADAAAPTCPADPHEPNEPSARPLPALAWPDGEAVLESVSGGGADRDVFVFQPSPCCASSARFTLSDNAHRLCVTAVASETRTNLLGTCSAASREGVFCCTQAVDQMTVSLMAPSAENATDIYLFVDPLDNVCRPYKIKYGF